MKKNTLHKVMATALVGAMAMSTLTGCGSSADNTTADAGTKESVAESSAASTDAGASTAVAGIDGWEAFADNVTLQIPVYDRGSSGNGCSDVENNYWTNWVQENFGDKYNITVEYVGITRSDVMTDYAMLAASQSLPTICMEYDYDKLASWQADGYLQTYDVEEFKQIAPTYWETMVEHGNDAYTKLDDEDYLVLGYRPYGNTTYTWCTFYRQDWLEEAGFSEYPVGDNTKLLELYAKLVENGHKYPLSGKKVSGAGIDQNYGYRDYPQDETWGSSASYRPGTNFGMMIGFANDATEDEVKAAMMYLEWLNQPENLFTMQWGVEGVNFNYDDNGDPVAVADQTGLAEQQGHNNNVDYWCAVTAVKTLGSIEKDIKAITPQGIPQDFYDQIRANYNGQVAIYDAGKANSDCLFATSIDAVTEYNQTLYDLYTEYRDKLTMCSKDQFDALYDELSQKYLEAGYQEVIDERQAALDDGNTTRLQ